MNNPKSQIRPSINTNIIFISILFIVSSCDNTNTKTLGSPKDSFPVQTLGDIITLCGAGNVTGAEASLAAEMRKTGGEITADFEKKFAAAVLDNRENLESSDIKEIYFEFNKCVDKRIDDIKTEQQNTSKLSPIIDNYSVVPIDWRSEGSAFSSKIFSFSHEDITMIYSNTNPFKVKCKLRIENYKNTKYGRSMNDREANIINKIEELFELQELKHEDYSALLNPLFGKLDEFRFEKCGQSFTSPPLINTEDINKGSSTIKKKLIPYHEADYFMSPCVYLVGQEEKTLTFERFETKEMTLSYNKANELITSEMNFFSMNPFGLVKPTVDLCWRA